MKSGKMNDSEILEYIHYLEQTDIGGMGIGESGYCVEWAIKDHRFSQFSELEIYGQHSISQRMGGTVNMKLTRTGYWEFYYEKLNGESGYCYLKDGLFLGNPISNQFFRVCLLAFIHYEIELIRNYYKEFADLFFKIYESIKFLISFLLIQ